METVQPDKCSLGGRSEVILPDGSKVKLNAGSNISYSNNFGYAERNILLEGEGYFEVETNPQIPFVVEASGLKIKAFGTIFNVKAYPEEEEITTTLVEGMVKLREKTLILP
jgi:transmembrane sensor